MNVRMCSSKLRTSIAACCIGLSGILATAQTHGDSIKMHKDSISVVKYEMRLKKREDAWSKLIPEMLTVQYAGDIGMISAGPGWAYGKGNRWETHLLLGFLPKRYNYQHYWTFTIRESFTPWRLHLKNAFSIQPLTVNLSVNSILHSHFWTREPSRYPNGYYGFSSRVRFHLGLGSRLSIQIPRHRRLISRELSIYYEISTCDLYVRQKLLNSYIPLKDILAIGIGVIYTI